MADASLAGRVAALRALLQARHLDALILTHMPNVRYLSAFTGSLARMVVGPRTCDLVVDVRYHQQATLEAPHCRVLQLHGAEPEAAIAEALQEAGARRVGFESGAMTYWEQGRLECLLPGLAWVPAGGEVEELREIKDPAEIACLRTACRATLQALDEALDRTCPGQTEAALAGRIEGRMRAITGEAPAFPALVASGARSARIHAAPTLEPMLPGEPVVIDCGASAGGYKADCCRTVCWGQPGEDFVRIYQAVREALEKAIAMVRPGQRASEVDAAAREVLARHGLLEAMPHGLGHGVGLEIHEAPWIAPGEPLVLRSGMTLALEPGVYREGWGGVRLEETILVTSEGVEVLTGARAAGRSHGVI